jgi:hypothetical protein
MKKTQMAIVCLLSIFVMLFAGTASAYSATDTHTCYMMGTAPTIDGKYAAAEYVDAASIKFGLNGVSYNGWTMSPVVFATFCIETWDTTNDDADYWEITFDSTAAGGATEPNGGTAPQVDDFKLVVTGHTNPTVQWYKGTGTGWAAITPTGFGDVAVFQQVQSLTTTPMYATAHYVWEMHIDKTNTVGLGITAMGYNWAEYLAYYDAHTGGYGLQKWPATATDTNPNSWGYVTYQMAAAPEGFNVGIVLALTSVAAVAGVIVIKRAPLSKYVTVLTSGNVSFIFLFLFPAKLCKNIILLVC